jgi:glycolate oxidase iron-sulfur subunit
MQTQLDPAFKDTPAGREADEVLRTCVHCGFCLATCPTYQLLGDELDSPRGRIYLMKQMFEGKAVTQKTQSHLDRCLTCRACETTCPSGVEYGKLVDIGRAAIEERVPRPPQERAIRYALRKIVPRRALFGPLMRAGRIVRPLLPAALRKKVSPAKPSGPWPARRHRRNVIMLEGCVQPVLAPNINSATARVLDALGISVIRPDDSGCCGALAYHLNHQGEGLDCARRNINAWSRYVDGDQGVEAIVVNASGCGTMVHEYAHHLRLDPAYAQRATRVSARFRDLSQAIAAEMETLRPLLAQRPREAMTVAFHTPCSLQHGLKLQNVVEPILVAAGFKLTAVRDAHLCCGSAGTYSILEPTLAERLKKNKLEALMAGRPDVIATANIGCLTHLEQTAPVPVRHWIELLDERLRWRPPA